eukprot:3697383-Amphidinium_carterae.1
MEKFWRRTPKPHLHPPRSSQCGRDEDRQANMLLGEGIASQASTVDNTPGDHHKETKAGSSPKRGARAGKYPILGVGQVIDHSEVPADNRVWTGRWCHRKKNGGVRSRYVVRQYNREVDTDSLDLWYPWTRSSSNSAWASLAVPQCIAMQQYVQISQRHSCTPDGGRRSVY